MTLSPPAPPAAPRTRADGTPVRVSASAGRRAGAYLIDVAIVAAAGLLVWLLTGSVLLVVVVVVELWALGWVWEGHTGATPGNLICGIRTVQRGSLLSVGAPRLLARSLLMGVSHIVPVLLPVGLAASGALDGVAGARVIDVGKVRRSAGAGLGAPVLDARVSGVPTPAGMPSGSDQALITRTPGAPAPVAAAASAPAAALAPAPPVPGSPTPVPTAAPSAEPDYLPPGAPTVAVFELVDGTVIRATGLGFIGRAPRAPESIPDAILVRVPDGARSLSRTHASFGIEEGRLWVQDLGSANGAAVRHLGGSVTDLSPHTPFFLVPGDVLVLGGDAELSFRRVVDRSAQHAAAARTAAVTPSSDGVAQGPAAPEPPAVPAQDAVTGSETPAEADAAVDAPQPAPLPPAVALQFQDGTTVPIRGTGYIGRAPSLPDGERPDAALIAVPDGDRSVSRTHGRFGVLQDQTWFEDLGSGNGSALRTGDGRSGPMTPHQRFTLVPGMVLQLGDCAIRVVAG